MHTLHVAKMIRANNFTLETITEHGQQHAARTKSVMHHTLKKKSNVQKKTISFVGEGGWLIVFDLKNPLISLYLRRFFWGIQIEITHMHSPPLRGRD